MLGTKRLYRSRTNRMLCGVAGGIAEYFDVDPTIVRLGLVVALVFGHLVTVVLYVAACLIIPDQPVVD
jgi:phage shock protein PspC (stress-responsive transcriptional regulator)